MPSTRSVPIAPGRLPLLGHGLQLRQRPLEFLSSVQQLGSIVEIRLGPMPAYFVSDAALVERILVTDAGSFNKGVFFEKLRALMGLGLLTMDGEAHRSRRRLVQPAFHRARIVGYAQTLARVTEDRISQWPAGQVIDVDAEVKRLALDIVASTLFAAEFGGEAIAEMQRCIPFVMEEVARRAVAPSDLLEKLPTKTNRRFNADTAQLRTVIGNVIAAQRASGVDQGDILSMLLAARDEQTGETMTDDEICDEIVTIVVAAFEATSAMLAWIFHELAAHPDIERQVRAETDRVLGDRPIEFDDIPQLDYMRRFITEILRLYGPWQVMRGAMTSVELGGVHIEEGTQIIFSPYLLHRDPQFFPDPERLDPDRWLSDRAKDIPRRALIPFGAGNRQCAGDRFAWAEMITILATAVRHWHLRPDPSYRVRMEVATVVRPSSVPMIPEPRVPAAVRRPSSSGHLV